MERSKSPLHGAAENWRGAGQHGGELIGEEVLDGRHCRRCLCEDCGIFGARQNEKLWASIKKQAS